ncbi:TMEM164 family-domain-containing protein [Halteromyces radiatus]|uniref:TMEM164 family-domain-containing protein n=1 Tax=Halteromyces radiatus TaxID=101107 RepID=UPI00221E84C2|nr:TMEM164 family-domain-containing protein [Halteromyces radiatus]KAI8096382.1 TMEM164 family-domain-containing protein [Halteromyces radiatus]
MAVVSSLKGIWWNPFVNRLEKWLRGFAVDVPEEPDWKQSTIGSWYIHPRQHAIELVFLSSSFAFASYYFYGRALGPGTLNRYLLTHFVPPGQASWMEKGLLASLVASLGVTLTHKMIRKNVLFMLQPCHVNCLLLIFTMMARKTSALPHILFNIYLHTQWGAIAALVFPDLRDHQYLGETFNFFAEHILILLAPVYMIYSRRYLVLPTSPDMAFLSFSLYSLFHSPLLHICALKSGLNLNYLFTPPPSKSMPKGSIITNFFSF